VESPASGRILQKHFVFEACSPTVSTVDLAANLERIHRQVEAACERAHRDRSGVSLLAVAKGQPPQRIRAAAELGLTVFGENRVQEAKIKIGQCPAKLRWHMIGHLQSNKCRDAVHFFQMIQSVDSFDIAEELDKWSAKAAKTLPVLLEVNVAGEATKFGFKPEAVLSELARLNALRRLEIHGLMTIAPWSPEPERARPFFRRLRELKGECEEILGAPLPQLSMGMSGDFEVAIEEGATMIRIGTALFGDRQPGMRAGAGPQTDAP
jgi:pyridoxal phosphate enzyme (YggS family)